MQHMHMRRLFAYLMYRCPVLSGSRAETVIAVRELHIAEGDWRDTRHAVFFS
jgi:hypothetical protein